MIDERKKSTPRSARIETLRKILDGMETRARTVHEQGLVEPSSHHLREISALRWGISELAGEHWRSASSEPPNNGLAVVAELKDGNYLIVVRNSPFYTCVCGCGRHVDAIRWAPIPPRRRQ